MKIIMMLGETIEIGFWQSEEDVIKVEYIEGGGLNTEVKITASLPDSAGREGIIFHEISSSLADHDLAEDIAAATDSTK